MANFDYGEFINVITEKDLIHDETLIHIASGEVSINLRKNNIYDAVGRYRVMISTNAVIFDENIAGLASRPGSHLCISPDAGTRQTYKMVKGIDAFDQVWENIRRYIACGATIGIKYIITSENCCDEDVCGLLEELSKIKGTKINFMISADGFRTTTLTDKQVVCAAKMINGVIKLGIRYYIVTDLFTSDEIGLINKAVKLHCN